MQILARRENSRNRSSKSTTQFSVDRTAQTPVLEVVQGRNSSSHQATERQRCRQCRSKLPAPTDIPQYAFCTAAAIPEIEDERR